MHYNSLPAALQHLLRHANWAADTLGQSSAQTFQVTGPENFYLKIQPVDSLGGLQTEANALVWLRTQLPAPEVIYYERVGNVDYLLMRALPGLPASDPHWQSDCRRLVIQLAESLRQLHALDIATCPFDQRTETKLREVSAYVEQGLVDEDDFDPENMGQSPEQLLNRVLAEQPVTDDLVVTHGDFCLPNIILANWELSGFIDVGGLGVGDRYQDLALCTNSLAYNLGTDQYNSLFVDAYGLSCIDEKKVAYFRLLDELK